MNSPNNLKQREQDWGEPQYWKSRHITKHNSTSPKLMNERDSPEINPKIGSQLILERVVPHRRMWTALTILVG